ncbi:MAG: YCF48-related protein [Bacteroidota bacterium]|nr:YCF48-related protein [Bacteroidota bacterium]
MKNLLLIAASIIFLSLNAFTQEGWIDQTPPSPLPGLYGVYAIDSDNIWAVGEEGTIIHSINGGETWDLIPVGTMENLYTVEFINSDTGWVAGHDDGVGTTVLRTTDGGLNWEEQSLTGGGALNMYDLDFIEGPTDEPMRGFITGDLGYTWRTEDFGTYWDPVRNQCENTFWSCCFVNKDIGWFVGEPSVAEPYTIMHTADGGETWQEQTNPTERNLRGVCFGADQKGIAVGLVGTIIYTSDGGANWEASSGGGFKRWESVYLTETGKAWAVGADGNIAYSTDWGYSWETQESGMPVGLELWEVYFINDNEGWIVGGGLAQPGIILHTTNGGVITGVNEHNNNVDKKYVLEQNYPNPFNSSSQISYRLNQSGHITLTILDLLGMEVQILVNEFQTAGNYSVNFDGTNLASGVYHYQLKVGNDIVESKKMMLMK